MKCYPQNPCDEPPPPLFICIRLTGISNSSVLKQAFLSTGVLNVQIGHLVIYSYDSERGGGLVTFVT